MSANFAAARRANLGDLAAMYRLPKQPGRNTVGPRSLAFCHPNHSQETLEAYLSIFPQGTFVSETAGKIISFACAIRTSSKVIEEPLFWSDAPERDTALVHQKNGEWLYVSRLAYTAGPGHAHLTTEIGPLLVGLQDLATTLNVKGVAFPTRFPGLRERSGRSQYQKTVIADPNSLARSGLSPLGLAYYAGFRHEMALPNYLGDGMNFALMVWKNDCQ